MNDSLAIPPPVPTRARRLPGRRGFLARSAASVGVTSIGLQTLAACAMPTSPTAGAPTGATAAAAANPPQTLTTEVTEGPFYLDLPLTRAEIAEGQPGVPLDVVFVVQDAYGRPVADQRVDIWHCDAQGQYSGFNGQGDDARSDLAGATFLRGSLLSDAGGRVTFHSIYPGWYRGRTTHIHFKIRAGDATRLTSQLFLPDALSEALFTQDSAYRRKTLRDTLNATDGIAIEGGPSVLGSIREAQGRYVAEMIVRIDPSADSSLNRRDRDDHRRGPPGTRGVPPWHGVPPPEGEMPGIRKAMHGMPFGRPPGPPPLDGRQPALEGEARWRALIPHA